MASELSCSVIMSSLRVVSQYNSFVIIHVSAAWPNTPDYALDKGAVLMQLFSKCLYMGRKI